MKKTMVKFAFAIVVLLLLSLGVSAAEAEHRVFTQAELQGQVPLDDVITTEVQELDRFGPLAGFEKVYAIEGVAEGESVDYYLPFKGQFSLLTCPTNSTLSRTLFLTGNNNAHMYQKWRFVQDQYGDYVVYSYAYPTKCLTINYSTLEVTLAEYTGSQFQKWGIYLSSNGHALVSEAVSQCNGFKLTYSGGGFSVKYSEYSPLYFFDANSFVPTESIIVEDVIVGQDMTVTVKATVYPSNATIGAYTNYGGWSVPSPHGYFTSTPQGRVTGISNGSHILWYTDPMTKNGGSCTVTVIDSYESMIGKFEELYDIALSYNSSPKQATMLSLQFVRRERYNSGNWATVAGAINNNFVAYVQTQNPSIYQFFTMDGKDDGIFMDRGYKIIEFPHFCATMNGLLYDSTGFKAWIAGEANIDNLCGWAGDLQTLCIDALTSTNYTQSHVLLYQTMYDMIGDDKYSMSMMDIYADTDSYNVFNELNSSCSNTISALISYYDAGYETRFTSFTNGWTKTKIWNCVRLYTTNTSTAMVDWPLLNGYDITDTQADAMADAFTDYVWGEILNESN